jgi:hypothetical protein
MNRRSDERDHLTLQVLLLAEQEITTLLDIEPLIVLDQSPVALLTA